MLFVNSRISTVQCAIGQYLILKVAYSSDKSLTDKFVRFNPGVYTDSKPYPAGIAFIYKYSEAGTYEMGNNGVKNHRAFITIIDAHKFEIEYRFFVTKNLFNYYPNVSPNYSNIFEIGTGESVSLGFYVKISKDEIITSIPLSINKMLSAGVTFDDDGFIPNIDLQVSLKTDTGTANNFYIGLIKIDSINSNLDIVEGLVKNYAQVGDGVIEVEELPNSSIISGYGFMQIENEYFAEITISKDILISGSTYYLYAVYFQNGEWKSCRSGEIKQNNYVEPIIPVVSYNVVDEFGNSANYGCIKGLAKDTDIDVSVTIDTVDYANKLTLAGYTGTFETYLEKVKIYEASSQEALAGSNLTYSINGSTYKVAKYKTSLTNRYIIFQFIMNFPGYKDIIIIPVQLVFDGINIYNTINVYADGEKVYELCEDGTYNINENLEGCKIKQSIEGSVYTQSSIIDGTLINQSLMPSDMEVCLKIICDNTDIGGGNGEENPVYDCNDICSPITIGFEQTNYQSNDIEYYSPSLLKITVNGGNIINSLVEFNYNTIGGDGGTSTATFNENKLNISTNGYYINGENNPSDVYQITLYHIFIEMEDGCVYDIAANYVIYSEIRPGTGEITYTSSIQSSAIDCNNEAPPICKNVASINYVCNKENKTIEVTITKSFDSPVHSEKFQYSTDGGTIYEDYTEPIYSKNIVHILYEVSFTDGCKTIQLREVIDCNPLDYRSECNNTRSIELAILSGALEITMTDTIESVILHDLLYISLDNGNTYEEYAVSEYTPIPIKGNEIIKVYTETYFDDEWDMLNASAELDLTSEEETEDCEGYDGYDLTASYNQSTGKFTITKTGSESELIINNLLFSLNGTNPFDVNNIGIPYTEPIPGEGTLIARWKIKKINCATLILDAYAYGRKKTKVVCVLNRCTGNEYIVSDIDLLDIIDPSEDLEVIVNTTIQSYVSGEPQTSGQYTITASGKLKFFIALNNATIKITQYPYL